MTLTPVSATGIPNFFKENFVSQSGSAAIEEWSAGAINGTHQVLASGKIVWLSATFKDDFDIGT